MKILVTGANGYIGRHVVKKLLDMNHEVLACSRNLSKIDSRANKIEADILSGETEDWYAFFDRPDACIHLAWRDGFVHNSPAHIEDLSGHYIFLNSLLKCGIKKLAVMGSMHEVGYFEGAIDENTPCFPQTLYGIAKDTLRRCMVLSPYKEKGVFQWLRAFYIYGDDLNNHSVFTKLIEADKKGCQVFPFTSGKNRYDFINIETLSTQIAACILCDDKGGTINCCTGEPRSLAEMAEAFIESNQLSIKLQYGAFPDRKYDSPGVWGNADRITAIMKRCENRKGDMREGDYSSRRQGNQTVSDDKGSIKAVTPDL